MPPVDEVFVLSAQATAPDRIEVRWRIADGYYLYRHRTSVKADAASPARPWRCRRARPTATNSSATSKPTARNCSAPSPARLRPARARPP
ncbi:protein-disulfide reductase DsbD domain-containing protein [Klebsiella pneumoniae]